MLLPHGTFQHLSANFVATSTGSHSLRSSKSSIRSKCHEVNNKNHVILCVIHHRHSFRYKILCSHTLCLPQILRKRRLGDSYPAIAFRHIERMDELEIYGSRKAVCPLYGESYHKRASNMLNIETPRPKQAVTKTWSAATKALYVCPRHFL